MSIESEIAALTAATTALLNAVSVSKVTLDNSLQTAYDAATRAETAAVVLSNVQMTAPELRSNGTHFQWRPVGSPTWIDLIAISDLNGPTLPTGSYGIFAIQDSNGSGMFGLQ